jgi:two-component system sensor histidine kinase UhpB
VPSDAPQHIGTLGAPAVVLVVEDDPSYGLLLQSILEESEYGPFEVTHIRWLSEALEALRRTHFDAIILDLSLPDSIGLDTLSAVLAHAPDAPVIVLTALADESLGIRAVQQGAQDYLIKGRVEDELLVRSVRYAIERRRAEERHRETEESFRLMFFNNPLPMWVYDVETLRFLEVNDAAVARYGYSRDEFLSMRITDIRPQEDVPRLLEEVQSERPRLQFSGEWRHLRKDGQIIEVLITSHALTFAGRRAALVVAEDITERKNYERQLEEHAASQVRLLSQLMSAQEAERRRLSRDIHDGPLQSLGVALLAADRAMRRYERGQHELVYQELRALRDNLQTTVGEIRAVLADLSLDILKTFGLAAALRNHLDRLSELTGLKVRMRNYVRRRLPPAIELLMYRLAQEALANVRKHSRCKTVTLTLRIQDNMLHMIISDDGVGFDLEAVLRQEERQAGHGLGLRSMQERVRAAGGDLSIESAPGKGTTLEFWCPLPR